MSETQGGPLTPVKVVTDAELAAGSYIVTGRIAWRAQAFSSEDRPVEGGPALPVYVVTTAQVQAGEFRVMGSSAMPIVNVTNVGAENRPTRRNNAMLVYLVGGSL